MKTFYRASQTLNQNENQNQNQNEDQNEDQDATPTPNPNENENPHETRAQTKPATSKNVNTVHFPEGKANNVHKFLQVA